MVFSSIALSQTRVIISNAESLMQAVERQTHLNPPRARGKRIAVALAGLFVCLWAMWFAGRDGLSRVLANYAVLAHQPQAASESIRLNSAEPETHLAQATLFEEQDERKAAARELELALACRPQDYVVWLQLAQMRDDLDDAQGALLAAREAVRLAPFYGQPRWELGNLLFRMRQRDEGLKEMRRAAGSDATLLPKLIDLSWGAYAGDAKAVENLINPQTDSERLELSSYLIKRGEASEAVKLFRSMGLLTEEQRRTLLTSFLNARRFPEAFEVWSSKNRANERPVKERLGALIDGGFEGEIALDDPGFGWQTTPGLSSIHLSQNPSRTHGGSYSLEVDFNGDLPPSTRVISQLVLIEPGASYRLNFSAATNELKSGGQPLITISDATEATAPLLGQTKPFPVGSSGWQDYSIEFTIPKTASAILIGLQRQTCTTSPCPIFGSLWLDDFSLQKLPHDMEKK